MTKFAIPALILCIFALFFYSVTSQSSDAPPEFTEQRSGQMQKLAPEAAVQDREHQPTKAADSLSAELKRLADEAKTNNDKTMQAAATLRSDTLKMIEELKASNDKGAQNILDQIGAIRTEQVKMLKDAKDTGDKTAQGLREEFGSIQARLGTKFDDTLKGATARSEELSQRVDAMKKDIDEVKKSVNEERQNVSNLSPGLAMLAALAALILGPFLAYQLTANHLAGIKQREAAMAERMHPAKTTEAYSRPEPPLQPHPATEPHREALVDHHAPQPSQEASLQHEGGDEQAMSDLEKV